MSMPSIPETKIDRDEAVNILIASIGMEEMALAHILNAEGEKIQFILGTLENQTPPKDVSFCDLFKVNDSVNKTIKSVIKSEIILQLKLEDAIELATVCKC